MSPQVRAMLALVCGAVVTACGARRHVVRPAVAANATRPSPPASIRTLSTGRGLLREWGAWERGLLHEWGSWERLRETQEQEVHDLAWARRWGDVAWLRGGGRVVLWEPIVTIVAADGQMRQGRGPGACDVVVPWGDDAFLRCGWGGVRVSADGRMVLVEPPRGEARFRPPARAVFSDDGAHVAFAGACRDDAPDPDEENPEGSEDPLAEAVTSGDDLRDEPVNAPASDDAARDEPTPAAPNALCVFNDHEHSWRSVDPGARPDPSCDELPSLAAMRGTTLVLQWGSQCASTFDVATGAAARLLAPTGRGAAWRVRHLSLAADGAFVALAQRCGPSRCEALRLLVGRSPDALTERPAPAGAERAAFADAARGVVWEAHVSGECDRVWRTVDGGVTWTLFPLLSIGACTLDGRSRRRWFSCGADGCSLGGSTRMEGWGPLPATVLELEE